MMKRLFFLFLVAGFFFSSCGENSDTPVNENTNTTDSTVNDSATRTTDTISPQGIQDSSMKVPEANAKLEIKTIKTDLGWGYDIYNDKSLYVHQPHIPAISGNKGFKNEADARKAAELVVHKIKNNIIPPSVSVKELAKLGIVDSLGVPK